MCKYRIPTYTSAGAGCTRVAELLKLRLWLDGCEDKTICEVFKLFGEAVVFPGRVLPLHF